MGNKSRYYDPDFKSEAVRLVLSDGRSIRDVERSLGIMPGVLKSWVRAKRIHDEEGRSPSSEVSDADSGRVKQLARVRMVKNRLLKGPGAIFRFIFEYRTEFPVKEMCRVLRVSQERLLQVV